MNERQSPEQEQLSEYVTFASEIATKAGQLLKSKRNTIKTIAVHGGFKGLVTDVDMASDTFLKQEIQKKYPHHGILTEESGESGGGEYVWIIDPLDGTNNFIRGSDWVSVSVALRKRGTGVIGVVYAPFMGVSGRLYTGAIGQGAFLTEGKKVSKLNVSNAISQEMFTMSFDVCSDIIDPQLWQPIKQKIVTHIGAQRFRGRMNESSALELCHVAGGQFDAFLNTQLKPWDIAAGEVIVREAGGSVTQVGETILLASNGIFHEGLLNIIHS